MRRLRGVAVPCLLAGMLLWGRVSGLRQEMLVSHCAQNHAQLTASFKGSEFTIGPLLPDDTIPVLVPWDNVLPEVAPTLHWTTYYHQRFFNISMNHNITCSFVLKTKGVGLKPQLLFDVFFPPPENEPKVPDVGTGGTEGAAMLLLGVCGLVIALTVFLLFRVAAKRRNRRTAQKTLIKLQKKSPRRLLVKDGPYDAHIKASVASASAPARTGLSIQSGDVIRTTPRNADVVKKLAYLHSMFATGQGRDLSLPQGRPIRSKPPKKPFGRAWGSSKGDPLAEEGVPLLSPCSWSSGSSTPTSSSLYE